VFAEANLKKPANCAMPLSLLLLLHVAQAFLGARRLYPEQADAHHWTGGASMQAMEDKMEASIETQEPQKTTEEYSALHSSQVKLQKIYFHIKLYCREFALLYSSKY
jgi:hypothetical protein